MKSASSERVLLAVVTALAAGACEVLSGCPDAPCDMIRQPASGVGIRQGIAGWVAQKSDVTSNGCTECTWGASPLYVWRAPVPATDAAAAEQVIADGPPLLTIDAKRRYEQALEPGSYLVCALPGACAAVQVEARRVVSVHVREVYGPTGLIVFVPGSRDRRDDLVFPVRITPPVVSVVVDGVGHYWDSNTARVDVAEPAPPNVANMRIFLRGVRAGRAMQFNLEQAETWPPRDTWQVALPQPGNNLNSQASEVSVPAPGQLPDTSNNLNARSGTVTFRVQSDGRFEGTFDLALVRTRDEAEPAQLRRGTFQGKWTFSCAALPPNATDGTVRIVDERLRTPFCADIAQRAGLRR